MAGAGVWGCVDKLIDEPLQARLPSDISLRLAPFFERQVQILQRGLRRQLAVRRKALHSRMASRREGLSGSTESQRPSIALWSKCARTSEDEIHPSASPDMRPPSKCGEQCALRDEAVTILLGLRGCEPVGQFVVSGRMADAGGIRCFSPSGA